MPAGRDRARRVAHASPVEQPWSPAALFAGLGFVASPITQFAAAGGRELSETISSVNAYHKGAIDEQRTRWSWSSGALLLLRECQQRTHGARSFSSSLRGTVMAG